MAPCEYVLKAGRMMVAGGEHGEWRCCVNAIDGSRFCGVHTAVMRGEPVVVARPRRRRSPPGDDVLPWSDDDRATFATPRKVKR